MKPVILVVDDDIAMGELLSDVLGAHAFEVLVCQTGGDALARVAQRADIALVLLDMILPDTHGLQVLQQLQRTRPELPVVMLSGLGSESDVVVGLEMGADDYIAKPFSSRVVVARVKAVLRRSGQNARRVLNREQLLALTHNESTEVFDRTIDVLIMRLRRKIELNPHQPTLIKTLRGLGYVFSADVTHSDKAA